MILCFNARCRVPLALLGFLLLTSRALAGFEFSLNTGLEFPGAQDHKYKFFNNGNLIHTIRTRDMNTQMDLATGITINYWPRAGEPQQFGIGVEYINWSIRTTVDEDAFRGENSVPDIRTIEQERLAFFVNLLRRPAFSGRGMITRFLYQHECFWGIGAGPVHTSIQRGQSEWKPGFQLLGSATIFLPNSLKLNLQAHYVLTHDADITPPEGWYAETSGTPTPFRFGPHQDTRFFGLTIGLGIKQQLFWKLPLNLSGLHPSR